MAHWNSFAAASAFAAAFSLAATPALARDHHHWRHRDRVDGGDVLAGALIVGGIAAIASAAKKSRAADDAPAPPPPVPDDQGFSGDQRGPGLDHAAGLCADAIKRGPNRVDTIDAVIRDRDGMSVEGTLVNGDGFDCRIGGDGQVLAVNIGGPASEGRDDDSDAQPEVDNRPVWHGDGGDQQQSPSQDDGRYSTSHAAEAGEGA